MQPKPMHAHERPFSIGGAQAERLSAYAKRQTPAYAENPPSLCAGLCAQAKTAVVLSMGGSVNFGIGPSEGYKSVPGPEIG